MDWRTDPRSPQHRRYGKNLKSSNQIHTQFVGNKRLIRNQNSPGSSSSAVRPGLIKYPYLLHFCQPLWIQHVPAPTIKAPYWSLAIAVDSVNGYVAEVSPERALPQSVTNAFVTITIPVVRIDSALTFPFFIRVFFSPDILLNRLSDSCALFRHARR